MSIPVRFLITIAYALTFDLIMTIQTLMSDYIPKKLASILYHSTSAKLAIVLYRTIRLQSYVLWYDTLASIFSET